MRYANQITYSTYNATLRLHVERHCELRRPYPLTRAGAERILRKLFADQNCPSVIRVEAMRDER